LHFIVADAEPAARAGLKGNGVVVFEMHGATIEKAEDLLYALAREMKLPEYFGMNWDALDECWQDMSWLPARGYVPFLHAAAIVAARQRGYKTVRRRVVVCGRGVKLQWDTVSSHLCVVKRTPCLLLFLVAPDGSISLTTEHLPYAGSSGLAKGAGW
jgi:hypothetical protein